jgi:hypothetical protein
MKATMALAALGAFPCGLRARDRAPALFVYDGRFPFSRQFAEQWQMAGVAILDPREHDLGLAWREHIPGLLEGGGRIEGATLWSDRFICETFARERGMTVSPVDVKPSGMPGDELRHWAIV